LDASDQVLHEAGTQASEALVGALGAGFERSLSEIYERARTREELTVEIRRLRDETEHKKQRFNDVIERTAGVIETRLHEQVRERFRDIAASLPKALKQFDAELERVATAYLHTLGVVFSIDELSVAGDGKANAARAVRVLSIPPGQDAAGLQGGLRVSLSGARRDDTLPALHPAHPLVRAAIDEARSATSKLCPVRIALGSAASALKPGQRGVLLLEHVTYRGFEDFERLIVVAVFEDGSLLVAEDAERLLQQQITDRAAFDAPVQVDESVVNDGIEEALFLDQRAVTAQAQLRFEGTLVQLDRYIADQTLVLRRRLSTLNDQVASWEATRDAAVGSAARTQAETRLQQLQSEAEAVALEVERLNERKDERFDTWSERAHQRRYAEPTRRRLLRVELELS
jgi:hypothetical protein